jgi:WD40 repeat protein
MDLELEREVHRIFGAALDRPEDERAAFVAAACADRPELLARLQGMFEALPRAEGFLEDPAVPGIVEDDLPDPAQDLVGTRIGRYEVMAPIGAGGMGAVFLAEQDSPRRAVALKVMRSALASRNAVRRFEYEAEVLGRLQHPNIAQVYEAGTHRTSSPSGVLPYFAMEYVAGAHPITEYAERARLDVPARLRLFLDVCRGVHEGHQKGVIHRDLKPANILVGAAGVPKVIDFGVARATDHDATMSRALTDHGQMVGTLRYMSPEQSRVDDSALDVRSDVYALGLVLYELLCGCFPYDLEDVPPFEVPRVIAERAPRRPSVVDSTLTGDVEAIVLTALEKDRGRRYQSAADLARDIERFLNHEPIEAHPPSVLYHTRMFARRHRALVAVGTAAVLALVAAAAIATGSAVRAARDRDTAEYGSYLGNIAAAEAALRSHEYRRLRTHLAAAPDRYRGWEWRYLHELSETADAVRAHGAFLDTIAVAPDGSLVVTGARDGTLRLWTADGTAAGEVAAHEGWILASAFDPAGRRLVTAGDDVVKTWSRTATDTLMPEHAFPTTGPNQAVAISPDGATVVAGGDDRTMRAWDAATGVSRWTAATTNEIRALAFAPDGRRVTSGGRDGTILHWDIATGATLDTWPGHDEAIYALAYTPDGRRLLSASADRTVGVRDVASGSRIATLTGHGYSVWSVVVSRDGTRVLTGSTDHTIRLWDLDRAETLTTLYGHGDTVTGVAFIAGETGVASVSWDGSMRIWDETTREAVVLTAHEAIVDDVAVDPTGRLVASTGRDGTVRLWDATTFDEVCVVRSDAGASRAVTFDPSGRRLAIGWFDGTIAIMDTRTAERTTLPARHEEHVLAVAFTPDGRGLVSGGNEGTAFVWDLEPSPQVRGTSSPPRRCGTSCPTADRSGPST